MSAPKEMLLLAFLLVPLAIVAQSNQFDREEWVKLKEEVDFQKYEQKEVKKTKTQGERYQEGKKNSPSEANSQAEPTVIHLGPVAQIIIIVVFIILIVLLLYSLVGRDFFSSRSKILTDDQDVADKLMDENVSQTDLEKWLEQAISGKNYRMALRIYFLMAIQALDHVGLIKWKKEKTNWEYLDELKDHSLRDSFRSLSVSFDEVWYGEKVLSEDKMVREIAVYRQFLEQINGRKR
ncbi:MAG: hypothetical protein RLO17_15160 [Cyclobacteriaceae bacterium]